MNGFDKEEYLIDGLKSKYIGDDAAVVGDTLYSVDAFFEDVHFKREWMSMSQIGRKSVLVNLSDAIAMNAKPKFALISISLPSDLTKDDIDTLMGSIYSTLQEFDCEIIGGDTVGGDKLHISITIISKSSNPLLRVGLRVGDILAYTGDIGRSKRDLDMLLNEEKIDIKSRFYEPTLRAEFIYASREFLRVGMDISDGLFCDTNKLLDINQLGMIESKKIEESDGKSGEEYEMLIAFSPQKLEQVMQIARDTLTPINIFATVTKNDERFTCKSHHFR